MNEYFLISCLKVFRFRTTHFLVLVVLNKHSLTCTANKCLSSIPFVGDFGFSIMLFSFHHHFDSMQRTRAQNVQKFADSIVSIFCFWLDDFSQITSTTDFCNIFTCNLLKLRKLRFVCLFVYFFRSCIFFLGKKSHYVSINAYAYNQTPLTLSGNDSSVNFYSNSKAVFKSKEIFIVVIKSESLAGLKGLE